MTDVRPRWVHYRQQDHCELALLHLSGRVTSLVEPERFPGLCYAFFEVRDADRCPPHGAAGTVDTWHDLDECGPVSPYRSVDFATAFAAMRTGAIARRGRPGGAAWKIIDGRFCTERPDGEFLPEELYAGEVAGEWYLGGAKEGADDD